MKMETKKILVPTIIAIATLVVMTVGATYAFFTVGANDQFTTTTATATTGEIGGVAITKTDNDPLTLDVTATQMLEENAGTYYATGSTTPKTIGTISVTGAGTYSCTYSIKVTQQTSAGKSVNLYEAFQGYNEDDAAQVKTNGQIYFTVNERTFDFNTADLFNDTNNVYTTTVSGLTSSNGATVTSNLVIVNSETIDQTHLNNAGITLTYDVTSFECELTSN